jgi:hypothetical protein
MKAYLILVHDQSAGGTIRLAAQLAHDDRAKEFARERLAQSPAYEAVEVWSGGVKLCHVRRAAVAPALEAA